MRVEALHFKRCCCCLPLRYGLIFTGYLKLAICLLGDAGFIAMIPRYIVHDEWLALAQNCVCILAFLADTALNVVLLIGCHKKKARLLKIYNRLSIASIIVQSLLWIVPVIILFIQLMPYTGVLYAFSITRAIFILGFLNISFLVYLYFLTRSEIIKLENNCQFRFYNNAAEGECTMIEETGAYDTDCEPVDRNLPQPTSIEDDERVGIVENNKNTSAIDDDERVEEENNRNDCLV